MGKPELWIALRNKGYSPKATAVILGHATAESGCECDRVQGDFTVNRSLSKRYTDQVDGGMIDIDTFAYHGPNGGGYGLVQWTYPTRKVGLYRTAKRYGMSVGSEKVAVEWLNEELHQPEYAPVLAALQSDRSIREISDVFMHQFERPYDQSEAACAARAGLAQAIYDELGGDNPSRPDTPGSGESISESWPPRTIDRNCSGWPEVYLLQSLLLCHGFTVRVDGDFSDNTDKHLKEYQLYNGLDADGICGPATWRPLLKTP